MPLAELYEKRGEVMKTLKLITRLVLFDYWAEKIAVILILGVIFLAAFIFPNLHSVADPVILDGEYQQFYPTSPELASDWVLDGFRNIGVVIGGVIVLALIGAGFAKLYQWSHEE